MPKTGSGRKSRIDMSSEAGRMLLRDLINYKTTGFNPFIPTSYQTEAFWKSREVYQKVAYGAFLAQAKVFAEIAIGQMPSQEQKSEMKQIERKRKQKSKVSREVKSDTSKIPPSTVTS